MKNAGRARQAAFRLVYWSIFFLLLLLFAGMLAQVLARFVVYAASALIGLWVAFGLFCFYFFRDPEARVPSDPDAIVSPAHGRVDLIDEVDDPLFHKGRCRRVSIFLSLLDVHVQRAPVAGELVFSRYSEGRFVNALRADSAEHNENLYLGFESHERAGERVGVRLIAGLLARRIVPWVTAGEVVARGDRISLIQFGSRVELLLPLTTRVAVPLGAKVRAGETIVARRG
jgi:phosphatidylserine decarboxylase